MSTTHSTRAPASAPASSATNFPTDAARPNQPVTVELSADDAELILGALVRQLNGQLTLLEEMAALSLVCQLRATLR